MKCEKPVPVCTDMKMSVCNFSLKTVVLEKVLKKFRGGWERSRWRRVWDPSRPRGRSVPSNRLFSSQKTCGTSWEEVKKVTKGFLPPQLWLLRQNPPQKGGKNPRGKVLQNLNCQNLPLFEARFCLNRPDLSRFHQGWGGGGGHARACSSAEPEGLNSVGAGGGGG